jgi:hypothetical protein
MIADEAKAKAVGKLLAVFAEAVRQLLWFAGSLLRCSFSGR